jgi:hypothetical protein
MSPLQAARRDSGAGVRSRPVHASTNCAVGVYLAGAGHFLWWTLRLAGSYALFHPSNYGEVRRPPTAALVRARGPPKAVLISAEIQPGTASDNSEVLWPKPRISALERNIFAVILLQITAGTAKSGKENGRAYSSRYLIEQP